MFENLPSIAPKVLYTVGGFDITVTMFSCWIVTAALILFAVAVRVFLIPKWEKNIRTVTPLCSFLEWTIGIFDTESKDLTKKYARFIGPFYFGCAAFILFGVLIELFGLRSPLSDINCDIVLGGATFLIVQTCGILKHRAKRLKHVATVIMPLTDCIVPFSMALRLFGSIFSGYLIMEIVYGVMPYVLPVILEPLFTLFHALIQSYVFMFLSMNFVNEAIE